MYKRITALLLAICLVLMAAPVHAGAATGQQVSASAVTVTAGNTATVTLKAENFNAVATVEIYIYYDSAVLTLSSTANGSLLSGAQTSVNTAEAGTVKLVAMALSGISGTGNLMSLYFKTAADCAPGTYPIKVAVGNAFGTELTPVAVGAANGSVTVNAPVQTQAFRIYGTLSASSLQQDDTLSYRITNLNLLPFVSGDFVVEYDHALFAFDSVSLASALTQEGAIYSVNSSVLGQVRITYATDTPVNSHELFTVKLKVIADTDATTTVTAHASNMYREDLSAYLPDSRSDSITLKKLPEVIDYPDAFLRTEKLAVGQQSQSVFLLEAGAGVAAADFTVAYDPAVLRCVSVSQTEAVSEYGGMVIINDNYADGKIRFSYINMNPSTDAELPIVTVVWEPVQSPQAHYQLTVSGVGVVDAQQNPITLEYATDSGCIYQPVVTPPTCLEDGYTTFTCNGCGDYYVVDPVDKLGHDIHSYEAKEPTCTEWGRNACDACSRCDYTTGVRIPPLGHDEIAHAGKAVTCTDIGWDAYITCARCGYCSYEEIPALGHNEVFHAARAETCAEVGWEDHVTCSRCDYTTYVEIPALGHDEIAHAGQAATCTDIGWNAYVTCTRCNHTTYVEIPAGHRFVQAVCTACGEKQTPVNTWDISADNSGKLTAYLYENLTEGGYELVITGSGDMADYSYSNPWYAYRNKINRVTLPEGLTSIGNCAFYYCSALRQIVIPDSVERIGDFAFYDAKKLVIHLEGDALPAQQGSIWYWGTGYYLEPQKIILEEDATYVIDRDGNAVLAKYVGEGTEFVARETVDGIPVTQIGSYAFYQANNLKTYWVPQQIQTIGANAFYEVSGLVLFFESSKLPATGSSWSGSCPYYLAPLRVWSESDFSFVLDQSAQLHLVGYEGNAQEVIIPNRADGYPVEHIGTYAFQNKRAERIVLPEGIRTIGDNAFDQCSYLKEIQLPESLTRIGSQAFGYCTSMTTITIPDGVTKLDNTFVNCYALESVVLPQTLTDLGGMVFYGCRSLKEIALPAQLHRISGYSVFSGCSALKLVYIRSAQLAESLNTASAASGVIQNAVTVVVPAGSGTDYLASTYSYCETAQRDGEACDIYSLCAHAWQTEVVTQMVPCQTDGYVRKDCSACGVETEIRTPRHTLEQILVAPTCTEDGYTLLRCPDCGESYQTDPVEKLPHDLVNGLCRHCQKVSVGQQHFITVAEALTAAEGSYVRLNMDMTENVAVSADVYLDLNGCTLTGDVTVADGATLFVFDSATADYTAENRGKLVGTVTGNLARSFNTPSAYGHNYKYLSLKESDGSYSFHRYYLAVRSVILAPCMKGEGYLGTAVNYKTVFKCNALMAQYVTAYGTKLTGDKTAYADCLANGFTLLPGADSTNEQRTWLAGTMKTTNTAAQNAANALLAPVASAYIMLGDGLSAEVTSAPMQQSLQEVLAQTNDRTDLTEQQKAALGVMYNLFKAVLDTWTDVDLSAIKQYGATRS